MRFLNLVTSSNFKVIFMLYVLFYLCFYYRKYIEIPIMEEDSYEKNVVMYVVIGEPRHIAGNYSWHNGHFFSEEGTDENS